MLLLCYRGLQGLASLGQGCVHFVHPGSAQPFAPMRCSSGGPAVPACTSRLQSLVSHDGCEQYCCPHSQGCLTRAMWVATETCPWWAEATQDISLFGPQRNKRNAEPLVQQRAVANCGVTPGTAAKLRLIAQLQQLASEVKLGLLDSRAFTGHAASGRCCSADMPPSSPPVTAQHQQQHWLRQLSTLSSSDIAFELIPVLAWLQSASCTPC